MNSKTDNRKKRNLDTTKWSLAFFLLALMIFSNFYFNHLSSSFRNIVVVSIILLILITLATTNKGRFFLKFAKEAYAELKRVIWPTYQETLYTTLIVIAATFLMSMLLWGMDVVLGLLISFTTNLRF